MTVNKEILIFENSHTLSNFLIKKWMDLADEAISDHNQFTVALSGGKSPIEFYSLLSNVKEFDLWHKTHVFQVDERFVPPDDSKNNLKLLKDNLLQLVNIPQENIHSMQTEMETVAVSANEYAHQLAAFFRVKEKGALPKLDLVMLGIGEDGHTASLFPEDKLVVSKEILTVPVQIPNSKRNA